MAHRISLLLAVFAMLLGLLAPLTAVPAAEAVTGSVAGSVAGSVTGSVTGAGTGCATEPTPAVVSCFAVAEPLGSASGPAGYGPTELGSIYGVPAGAAATATVAVIVAGRNPQIATETAAYRSRFGLPACPACLVEVNQAGNAAPLPAEIVDAHTHAPIWHLEIALDVQMVTALCPSCRVLVVEADSADVNDLVAAVDSAVRLGAQYVSMSFGAGEWPGETALDAHFAVPGVVFVAATGDSGYGTVWPAVAPNVVAVGGATVTGSVGGGWSSTTWSGGGSGCSKYEQRGLIQGLLTGLLSGLLGGACTGRVDADLAGVSDPQTGVSVYSQGSWYMVGGTSAASPAVAALYALAGNSADPMAPYRNPASFVDITRGSTTGCPVGAGVLCTAGTGWDGPTGLGLPYGLGAFGGPASAQTPAPGTVEITSLSAVAAPAVIGRPKVGRRVRAKAGVYVDSVSGLRVPVTVKVQWYAGSRRLLGATRASLTVARHLRHRRVWFRATVTSTGYSPVVVASARKVVR